MPLPRAHIRKARREARKPKTQSLFGSEEAQKANLNTLAKLSNVESERRGESLGQQQDARGDLQGLLRQQQQIANDPSGSLAQAVLLQAQDANTAAGQSLAAGARGTGGQAAALRQAQQQQALGGQATAQSAAILRAQEQQAALSGAAGISNTIRQGDVAVAGQGLQGQLGLTGLRQEAAGTQLQSDLSIEQQRVQLAEAQKARRISGGLGFLGVGIDAASAFFTGGASAAAK